MLTEKEFDEGRLAYCDGKELTDNPYADESRVWNWWRQGWLNAKRRDPLRDDDEE